MVSSTILFSYSKSGPSIELLSRSAQGPAVSRFHLVSRVLRLRSHLRPMVRRNSERSTSPQAPFTHERLALASHRLLCQTYFSQKADIEKMAGETGKGYDHGPWDRHCVARCISGGRRLDHP